MKQPAHWALAFSLILNVLLAGFIAGRTMHSPFGPHSMRAELDGLSKEKRDMFVKLQEQRKALFHDGSGGVKELRKEVVDILTAPQFDEAKFRDASTRLNQLFNENKLRMIDDMAELAKQCTQEERNILAKHLRRPPPPPMGPGDGNEPPAPRPNN